MKKGCKYKAEFGIGNRSATIEEYLRTKGRPMDISSLLGNNDSLNGVNPQNINLLPQQQGSNFSDNSDMYRQPRWLGIANGTAQGVTFLANQINNQKINRDEIRKYYEELRQPTFNNNPVVNNLPAYTKYGGGLSVEKAKEMLRDGTANGKPLTEKQKRYFGYIAGGGKPKAKYGIQGNKWIEAEGGEVYEDTGGDIVKINDDAPDHEQGGVMITDVQRVLEDTSTKRKDKKSQILKIYPEQFKAMFGIDSKKPLSHSEAYEKASSKYEKNSDKIYKKINKSLKTLNDSPDDIYANNSLKLNMMNVESVPSREDIFEFLFENQEMIKQQNNIQPEKRSKYGIDMARRGYNDPSSSKTRKGKTSPTGQNTDYDPTFSLDYINQLWKSSTGVDPSSMSNRDFQNFTYNNLLGTPEGREKLRNVWSRYGNTARGLKRGIGSDFDFNNLTDDQLKTLTDAYVDGSLGARTLRPLQDFNAVDTVDPLTLPTPTIPNDARPGLSVRDNPPVEERAVPTTNTTRRKRDFYEPLHWSDLAGPLMNLASSERIPAKYNPAEFNEIRLKLQNPEPSLQAARRTYNSATSQLPSDAIGQSNLINMTANKYANDNQTLGQYENINTNIRNQEVLYNAGVRDKQSVADQQSRAVFEQQFLLGREAERQQRLQAFDDIFNRISLNRKLNREGNLLMKMFPNFNSYGEYNGRQRYFFPGVGNTSGVNNGQAGEAMNERMRQANIYLQSLPEKERLRVLQEYGRNDRFDIRNSQRTTR